MYADVAQECGELISRDAIVLLEGSLHEDRFRGGTAMRVRRLWDVADWFARSAQRVRLSLDTTVPGAIEALNAVRSRWQGGNTPLSIEILTASARGVLDSDSGPMLRADPELLRALREVPGARRVEIVVARPAAGRDSDSD